MKKGIAVAGNLIVDIVKNIDSFPTEGLLANINQVGKSIGGCAGNTLCDLAKIDNSLSLSCFGKVGKDINGKYIIDMLSKHGIATEGVVLSSKRETSFTDVMLSKKSGERTFFHKRGANAEFTIDHIDFKSLDCDIMHFGYALLLDGFDKEDDEYGTVMAKALSKAQSMGIKTSMDVVSEVGNRYEKVVKPSLKYCNYIILNEIESSQIVGIKSRDSDNKVIYKNLQIICKKLMDYGVSDMVVIHMPEYGCALTKEGEFYIQSSYKLLNSQIKGAVGAGDAFCAGMLYGIYNLWNVEKSLKFANMTAASCMMHENSTEGVKSKREICNMQKHYKLR